MADNKPSAFKSAMTSGMLLGIVLIVFSLIIYFLGLTGNKYISYVSILLMIAGVVYFQIQYRDKELGGQMSYGQAFGYAILMVLAASVLSTIFSFILIKFIDPGLIDKMLSMQEDAMAKKGLSQDQIDMAMNMVKRMMTPTGIAIFGILGMMFWGALLSLITSAFTRKESTPFNG